MDERQTILHFHFMNKMHWDMVYNDATIKLEEHHEEFTIMSGKCLAQVPLKFPSAGFHLLPIVHTVATIYKFAKGYMLSL